MCRQAKTPITTARPPNDAGFSLLELLVVLAIMSIVLSLAGVRMLNSLDGARFNRTADAAVADLLILRADAMLGGHALVLLTDTARVDNDIIPPDKQRRLALPQGWRVEGDAITVSATGVCGGGRLRLVGPTGRRIDYVLTPPKCTATRLIAPPVE